VGSRVAQFAQDFRALSGAAWEYEVRDERTIELRLADAMEFLETVSYTRNWLSEMHEQFCALSWADWRELVASVGLEIDERSGPWRNDWLVENRFAPAASLSGSTTSRWTGPTRTCCSSRAARSTAEARRAGGSSASWIRIRSTESDARGGIRIRSSSESVDRPCGGPAAQRSGRVKGGCS
jgi:hypothetical protein